MDFQNRINEILERFEVRQKLLLVELEKELQELVGLEGVAHEEIDLGDARKAAILTECLKIQKRGNELRKQQLSGIATMFGRKPGSVGIFFRADVNLMETKGRANLRYVTPKGEEFVKAFQDKFGDDWIECISEILGDNNLPDSYRIKLNLK
ncbi:hypothetical protein E9840_03545 [Tissierella creatinini]|nr:hypothetical protein E9840_03545 [Tissierella creatinini]TJX59364.1 hypothetical protein E8P77_21320 [Soehngenia saccharolytica]